MSSPAQMQFKLHSVGDVSVVEFVGRALDETSRVREVGRHLHELVDRRGHSLIVLDFANVRFLASSALGVLVSLQQKVGYKNGRLVICNLRSQLLQVFKFAQLEKLFAFYPTREDALNSFNTDADSNPATHEEQTP